MSHQRRTVDENITLDFFKLDCYRERIKISYSELSQAVGRSRNWLSGLKETCAAQSKPAVVDLPVAMLLANKLECTIQDIKQYTSGFHGKDPEKKSNVEYENQLKELSEICAEYIDSLPEELKEKDQTAALIKGTFSYIEKDYRTPITIDQCDSIATMIHQMDMLDRYAILALIFHMRSLHDEDKGGLRLLLLDIASQKVKFDYSNNTPIGGLWWINLFLSALRKEILKVQTKVHIPNETELRRIFMEKSEKNSANYAANGLPPSGKTALENSLKKSIGKIIDAVLENDDAIQNIVSACANHLYTNFRLPDDMTEMQNNLYKDGYF